MQYNRIKIYADGGSRGNPGPAATGYVITDDQDKILEEGGSYLAETTNNQAEYQAVILSLEKAKNYHPKIIDIYMDSQLVVNQLTGTYKIKNEDLKILAGQAQKLIQQFEQVNFEHVLRKFNKLADDQVNIILDQNS